MVCGNGESVISVQWRAGKLCNVIFAFIMGSIFAVFVIQGTSARSSDCNLDGDFDEFDEYTLYMEMRCNHIDEDVESRWWKKKKFNIHLIVLMTLM